MHYVFRRSRVEVAELWQIIHFIFRSLSCVVPAIKNVVAANQYKTAAISSLPFPYIYVPGISILRAKTHKITRN